MGSASVRPGCMVALGKELDLQHRVLRDTAKRVAAFAVAVESLCTTANANRRPNKKSRAAKSIVARQARSRVNSQPLTATVDQTPQHIVLGTPTAPIPDLRALIGQALFILSNCDVYAEPTLEELECRTRMTELFLYWV